MLLDKALAVSKGRYQMLRTIAMDTKIFPSYTATSNHKVEAYAAEISYEELS